ncbi:MAG: hypothetical protein AABY15_03150 [Nanoarchaeota archaeon]
MEKLKLFLAWLDWSTYARSSEKSWKSNYKFPNSLCHLAWRTLFSVIVLPFTWIAHVWNRLFVSMETFRNEDSDNHKLNVWSTIAITMVSLLLGVYAYGKTDGKDGTGGLGWDWFHVSDPIIISYFKLIGCGIVVGIIGLIMIAIFITIIALIIMGVQSLKSKSSSNEPKSAIVKTVKAIKNKYCPIIDWSFIRKK